MERGEEKAKRWRIPLCDLLICVTGIALAIGLMRIPWVALEFHEITLPMRHSIFSEGLFFGVGSIGYLAGRLHAGTSTAAERVFVAGGISVVALWFLLAVL